MTISVVKVTNPASLKETPAYSVATLTNTANYIQKNADPHLPKSTLAQPNTLTNVKVERNGD